MKTLFNDGWKFKLFGIGADVNAALDGAGWSDIEIPHDWLIYDASKLYETGEGWYKKDFTVTGEELNLVHSLIFDGVYMNSAVFVNGTLAGEWKYGYTAFCFDISAFLKEGINTVTVRVRHEAPNTRWYSGAGIYRNIWLNKQEQTRIINDGVYISSEFVDEAWELRVRTEFAGEADLIRHTLINADNKSIIIFENNTVFLKDITLWDINNPYVYKLKTELIKNNKVVDNEINPIGFRTIEFSPDNGFILNGRRVKLHGVCMHHDLGALGAAFNTDAARRQLEIMREMGANAIRISHNPPAREFLDLCDQMGLLVINEAFDMWELPKNKNDYALFFPDWYKKDVASWIRRDRNHPSVIMWSIGNEIYDTHKDERGLSIAKSLRGEVLKHDPYQNARVTIASNYMPFENAQIVADEIKLAGYNYAENMYDIHHKEHPDWFIYGSETVAAVRSRGVYRFPAEMPVLTFEDMQCSDLGNSFVGWGSTAEKAWIEDRDRDWCGGQFIWTGFDYIGEPTPYSTKNSYFGAVDTAGFPKAIYYFYKSVWNKNAPPFIRLFPHWDWNDGQIIDVIAYSNLEEAELFLNGKSLGRQKIDRAKGGKLRFEWKVPFEKGTVLVKAYDSKTGASAEDVKKTPGEPASIKLDYVNGTLTNIKFIKIYVTDKDNIPIENARNRISVRILDGCSRLIGLDNGDSTDYDSYKGNNRRLFGGQLLAVIKAEKSGPTRVEFSSQGLREAAAEFGVSSVENTGSITQTVNNTELRKNKDEMPLRRIELSADRFLLDKNNRQAKISAKIIPGNASYRDITWKCVLDTGVEAGIAEIKSINGDDDLGAEVTALGDGRFKVLASCNNGKDHPEIISELNFTVSGIGEALKNPFSFMSASCYEISYAPLKIIERGSVAGVNRSKTLIGFKNLYFGKIKADLLRLHIGTTSYFDEVLVEIHLRAADGNSSLNGIDGNFKLLETVSFPRNNLHYDYAPFDFRLSEKLSGKTDICFVVDRRCVFGGFEFINERAFEKIHAGEKDEIYGDNYDINNNKIENIGNNVIINFNALDFGENGARKIIISGFAPAGNTVSLRFRQNGGGETTRLLEFIKSTDYITREFDVGEIKGLCDISFIFLPGSNFNFEWFRFS